MNYKYKLKIVNTLLLIGVFCASCTFEEINRKKNTAASEINIAITSLSLENTENKAFYLNVHPYRIIENLWIDANVSVPLKNSFPALNVEQSIFNKELLCDVFLNTDKIVEENQGGGKTYIYNDNRLFINGDSDSFDFRTSIKDYAVGIINPLDSGNLNKFTKRELDFMTRTDAIEIGINTLKAIHITPNIQPRVYAMDYETLLAEQKRCLMEEGLQDFVDLGKVKLKEEWTLDDEFYYLFFQVEINGVPCDMYSRTHQLFNTVIRGSQIEMMIDKGGVAHCKVNGALYQEISSEQTESPLISFEEALDCLKRKYEKIILTDRLDVKKIDLIYSPIIVDITKDKKSTAIINKTIQLVPAWMFEVHQERTDQISRIRINAITGEEIP